MRDLYHLYILVFLLIFSSASFSQNLVPNCDFDNISKCPEEPGQFDRAKGWHTPTQGTSDLCHSCAGGNVNMPDNQWGHEMAYSGQGYGNIISYYDFVSPQYREYMQAELACPLVAGEVYQVSFYVSCSDNSGFAIDGLGLHFSDNPVTQNNNIVINLGGPPEISNPAGNIITKKDGWQEISGTYTAIGGERFITIGNFISDDLLAIFDFPGNLSNYCSYYVSHISVTPVKSMLDLGNDTTVCPGQVITADASTACPGHYLWNDGDTNAIRSLTQPGAYSVSVSIGCGVISDDILLEWYPEPATILPADTFLCPGGNVILDAGDGFDGYTWQDGSQGSSLDVNNPGTYWVDITDTYGCTYRDSSVVGQMEAPIVELGDNTELCLGDSLLLIAGEDVSFTHYTWQDQSTGAGYLVKSQGQYWVMVENACGIASDTIRVFYKDCETSLWVPNAFTPGQGGPNAVFIAQGTNLGSFHMYIYNRWGQKLFESQDISAGWDGTYSGTTCPGDVYVWMIVYTGNSDKSNESQVKKGNILLIR